MSRCLAALFLLAFASYLALMTPFVQTRLVTYFADLLGKRLGTEIVIGKVDFRPIESLVLSDVYVKGFANDTLLYCRRLTARVDSVSFVRRRATVTELDFDGAVFNLWVSRDSAGSRTNVEMLLDPLSREGAGSSRPGSPGWRVSLERIRLRNSRFRYMEDQYEPVEYGINWTDVDCRGLDADISGISFDGGTYAAEVSGLRFREKSGFRVNRMGGRVVIREDNMLITSADISTDKSFIHLDTLRYDWVPGASHGDLARLLYLKQTYDWLFFHTTLDNPREVDRDVTITKDDLRNAYSDLDPKATEFDIVDEIKPTKQP